MNRPVDARRPKRFWYQLGLGSAIACLVLIYASMAKESALDVGFFDQQMPEAPSTEVDVLGMCQWEGRVPWFDMIPFRLNFFTGPMTCPKDDTFSAHFSDDGELIVNCDATTTLVRSYFNDSVVGNFEGPAYSLLPETVNWGYVLKNDSLKAVHNDLQRHALEYIEDHTFPYEGIVRLNDSVDTVLVKCGSREPRLVTRIVIPEPTDTSPMKHTKPPEDGLNVVTLFIDAVSRPQFHRRLPKTRQILENLAAGPSSQSSLFQFWRYHTIGMNTDPNTRALWAGLETDESLLPTEQTSGSPLWEQFEDAGYTSARIDPMCQDWTAYYDAAQLQEESNGTTVYANARPLSFEHVAWSCLPPYMPVGPHFAGNFAGATSIKARCISDTHVGWHELDWASDFISTVQDKMASASDTRSTPNQDRQRAYYLNAAFMEGHEGSGEVLATLDDRLAIFLDPATSPIDFSNTAVVIVSDHGALMGLNYAFLHNGKVEAASPFAAMLLPDSYLERDSDGSRREKLARASERLVTAFDLYETMRGFMGQDRERRWDQHRGQVHATEQDGKAGTDERRGFDLIRENLPDRGCEGAGVPPDMCRCR
ncbi:MAG: hypothetical protein M1828_000819 [Chrysothrix sp. TS-e1954]|nr:MAG: hypothetical protein M1828_000819 [Chrysothrix sp. TS-e1954]